MGRQPVGTFVIGFNEKGGGSEFECVALVAYCAGTESIELCESTGPLLPRRVRTTRARRSGYAHGSGNHCN